jgi:D-glycero-alpha-D-manno-heptose-7-phosphate kinase
VLITKTPYRLSFFGGGTDYRPWFEKHGGLIIASAMARYCYLSVRYLPPFFEHKSRIVYGKVEHVNSNHEIVHPSVKHCLDFLEIDAGVEIHYDGDLPARSGIGSSSSFTVGLLHALHALQHKMVTKKTMADEAIKVEQVLLKEDVGIQDQIMAAHGGLQIIEMGPGNRYSVRPLIIPPDYLNMLEQHVLLGFTGVERFSAMFATAQVQNIKKGESIDCLSEIQGIAKEALGLFMKNAYLDEIGKLMDHSWRMKKQLAQGVSNDAINDLYTTAKQAGAFGGKLLGAGGGGFIMFLAPPEKHDAIKQALSHMKVWVPFKIDATGSQVIFHNNPNQ